MIKTLILILLYSYIIGMTGVLLYYLYLYWYAVKTAREYDTEITNWEIERKGIFYMFCPLLNCIATIVVWCCVPKAKTHIKYLVIMSTHPELQDDDDDEW